MRPLPPHRAAPPSSAPAPPGFPRAFTLVELLVVIAIAAVLVGLLLPALGRARDAARGAVCLSNARQLAAANILYAGDHRDHLAPHANWNRGIVSASGAPGVNQEWCFADPVLGGAREALSHGLLGPFLTETARIAGCPSFRTPEDVLASAHAAGLSYPLVVHYGYNGLLLGEKHPGFNAPSESTPGYRSWVGYTVASIPNPARTVMFADSAQRIVGRLLPQKDVLPPIALAFRDGSPRARASPSAHGRHAGRASVAWLDAHAAATPVSVYADQSDADRRDALGFLGPGVAGSSRDNGWMFVR